MTKWASGTGIGSLRPGKAADLCAIRLAGPETLPCYDVASHLVYVAGREQVSDVWVAGQRRVAGRRLLAVDGEVLARRAKGWGERIAAAR